MTPNPAGPREPRRRRSGARRALALAGLGCAGAAIVAVVLALAPGTGAHVFTASTPRGAVDAQLAAARDEDWPAVWELFCAEVQREKWPREEYVRSQSSVPAHPADRFTYASVAVRPEERDGRAGFAVGVLATDGRLAFFDEYFVVREKGVYRVCGLLDPLR